ncbi:uncharacterized protein V6R79_021511 [Siganus canaliculatus]
MATLGGNPHAKVHGHAKLASLASTNPFAADIMDNARVGTDTFDCYCDCGMHASRGRSSNPFVADTEPMLAASGASGAQAPVLLSGAAWPLTPPPSATTNPFISTPAHADGSGGEFKALIHMDCDRKAARTPAVASCHGLYDSHVQAPALCTFSQLRSGLTPANRHVSPITPQPLQPAGPSCNEQGHRSSTSPHRCGRDRPNANRAWPATRDRSSYTMLGCELLDSSDDESYGQKERIPTLQPGKFDGSTSWKDFLYQFENCAKANHWSEKTMAVQLRFSLTGAAGAIVHKNPRSSRWSYQRIVDEVETAYGPCSEHAAAIGIELRQRVRKPGETLHSLRDDIYEKVSIVYAGRTELEQEAVSVEIFTNALADAEVVQRLLRSIPVHWLKHMK